jgi:hypothetical protein
MRIIGVLCRLSIFLTFIGSSMLSAEVPRAATPAEVEDYVNRVKYLKSLMFQMGATYDIEKTAIENFDFESMARLKSKSDAVLHFLQVLDDNIAHPSTIQTRSLYQNSAIVTTKSAILPNQPVTTNSIINDSAGITSFVIDIKETRGPLVANEVRLYTSTRFGHVPFAKHEVVPTITWQAGVGANNSDRAIISFPSMPVKEAWLQVKILAGPRSALPADDTFYFGHFTSTDPCITGVTPWSQCDGDPSPKVESVVFGDGSSQRSMIKTLKVTFDSNVTLDANAFSLESKSVNGGGTFTPVTFTTDQVTGLVDGKTVVTLTFAGAGIVGGSLPDGNYRITALSSKIRSTFGNHALDGDNNSSAGGDFVKGALASDNLFRLFSDSDGNGVVNAAETNRFRLTTGKTSGDATFNPLFDFDSNGSITPADTNQFRLRVGKSRSF